MSQRKWGWDFFNHRWVMMFAPKHFRSLAITLGPFTFYSVSKQAVDADPEWERHEDDHKWQYLRLLYIGYPIVYLFDVLKAKFIYKKTWYEAYHSSRFERWARS